MIIRTLTILLVLSCQLLMGQTIGGHAISIEEEQHEEVYIYFGSSHDWNQLSSAWDAKRISREVRARTVLKELNGAPDSEMLSVQAWLMNQPEVVENSVRAYWIASVLKARVSPEFISQIEAHPAVASVQPVPLMIPDEEFAPLSPAPFTPNGREAGHDVIGANTLWKMGYTGYGKKAYIIDSGVDPTHPALGEKYWGNYAPTTQAWFEPGGSATPQACGNHGTLVAGVILGLNRGTNDTTGVAPEGLWMASPPAGGAPCASVDILASLEWALNPDGDISTVDDMPDVINNSWSIDLGSSNAECTGPYRDAMAALEAAGIAVIFSAGNSGPGPQSIPSPKNLNINHVNIFTVGSVNGNSATLPIAGSSSRGPSTCVGPQDTIKPEVVAPGVQVRTTGLNGGYFNVSGTSFAAPQAAGAVLLLREAFPTASGKQILESLYFSATDLGDPGEDNTYGNGVISLPAAFAWLQTQGFAPIAINDSNNVAISGLILGEETTCDSIVYPFFAINNPGPNQITTLAARRNRDGVVDTIFWQGTLAPGGSGFWGLPGDTIDVGVYQFELEVFEVNGMTDGKFLDNYLRGEVVRLPAATAPISLPPVCVGAQIEADAGTGSFAWYADNTSTTPFATTSKTLLGPFQQSTTVFVARTELVTAGKANTADVGNYTTDFAFLRFDAELPFRLKSVQVYSQGDGNRRFQLRSSTGMILKDTTMFLNFGPRIVTLNMDVPAGTGYELGVNSGQVRLLTTTEGVAYPYVSENVVSITGSTLGATSYPYLFDWEISYEGCRQAVPVEVIPGDVEVMISPKDTAIYLALGGEMSFSNSSPTITNAIWTWGDGNTGTGPTASHIYDSAGVYSVYLTAESQNGCAGSDSARVTVLDWALSGGRYGGGWTLDLYPNPAKDRLILSWQALPAKEMSIELFDLQGRILVQETIRPTGGSWPLELSSVSPGSYVLKCVSGEEQCIHRIQVNP